MSKTEPKDEIIQGLMTTINNLNEEISLLREQVAYLTQKLYGKSSEQTPLSGQISLFDEENFNSDEDENNATESGREPEGVRDTADVATEDVGGSAAATSPSAAMLSATQATGRTLCLTARTS